jgi:hypothetical protein
MVKSDDSMETVLAIGVIAALIAPVIWRVFTLSRQGGDSHGSW